MIKMQSLVRHLKALHIKITSGSTIIVKVKKVAIMMITMAIPTTMRVGNITMMIRINIMVGMICRKMSFLDSMDLAKIMPTKMMKMKKFIIRMMKGTKNRKN